MILTRLSRAIARQNRGTVALEVLVVVGIFPGLQVDELLATLENAAVWYAP